MRKLIQLVKVTDDLDLAHGRETEVGEDGKTVTVGLNGVWAELDLTAEHAKELEEFLRPYLAAGSKPERLQQLPPTGKTKWRRVSREYAKGMREFANQHGISYRNSNGGYYYPRQLHERYAAHLAAQEGREQTAASG